MSFHRVVTDDPTSLGVPVDAHMHFHKFDLAGPTLDAAAENFTRVRGAGGGVLGVLMLVQSAEEHVFEQLVESGTAGRWRISSLPNEPESLLATCREQQMLIVCGRQISCSDDLEVLALGAMSSYPPGVEAGQTIERVLADGHIAVVPWGFLKWRGWRGEKIRSLMSRMTSDLLFFGDNGGRLEALGMPRLLQDATNEGFRVLPGTDPFPFGGDYRRVGSFGFIADVDLARPTPWATLRRWLKDSASGPKSYGNALGPWRFVLNQGWIQVRKRILSGASI